MAERELDNLRIHFHGVQGSGSTYPLREERRAFQEMRDCELLEQVFRSLRSRAGVDGSINQTVEQALGGALNRPTLLAYLRRFAISEPRVYGGWTTCLRVETADGDDLVFDCGSGFRNGARDLQDKWGARPRRRVHIFGSHSHADHTEGYDQAALCFDPRNTLHIYGNRQFLRALDQNLGIFTRHVATDIRGVHTPISYAVMPASFESIEIRDLEPHPPPGARDALARRFHHLREPIRINGTTITATEVYHPAPCLAYRVERGGRRFVFCTDHELRHGDEADHPHQKASLAAEARVREMADGADLLYRDGQYFRAEYDGVRGIGDARAVPRLDWGRTCIEDVVRMAGDCRIRRTLIGHHDPNRGWAERNELDDSLARACRAGQPLIGLARAETFIDL